MTNATETAPANPSPSSEPVPKRFQCRHILTSGRRCRSASLHGEQFCYYHHTTRRPAPRHRGVHPAQSIFEMPLIDDREGIQFALAQILNRLTTGQLDPKRANPILYTLKLAIWNLHETRPAAAPAATAATAANPAPPPAVNPSPPTPTQTIQTNSSKTSSSMKTSAPSPPSPKSSRPRPPNPASPSSTG